MEAKAAIGLVWPRAARHQLVCGCGGAHRGGADAAAVERKASGRHGGKEGMGEAWWRGRHAAGVEERGHRASLGRCVIF
jgi:hypothetical protein